MKLKTLETTKAGDIVTQAEANPPFSVPDTGPHIFKTLADSGSL